MSAPAVSREPAAGPDGWRVWGQDRVVGELKRAATGGPRHAYILGGPHQSGKATIAREFAKTLLCGDSPEDGIPCGNCRTCRLVARGVHPDVSVFDLASQAEREGGSGQSKNLTLNIDTVRAITSSIALRPAEADWRIVIVDDIESMQETAQEAFLKTLEEPPRYAIILLLTTDGELLLPTIRSRCVGISLRPAPVSAVHDALVASGADPEVAGQIAGYSQGRVGWAFRALADPALLERRVEDLRVAVEWATGDAYRRLVQATKVADQFSKDREAVYERLLDLQQVWRSVLLNACGTTPPEDASLDVSPPPDGRRVLDAVRSVECCVADLEANVRPRLALQTMVLQWPTLT